MQLYTSLEMDIAYSFILVTFKSFCKTATESKSMFNEPNNEVSKLPFYNS